MVSNRLKEVREKEGLSQVELGWKAKIASQNISAIEKGRLLAWDKMKRKLAKALKTTPGELFPNED